MKISLVAILLLGSVPVNAHEFRTGYSRTQVCSKTVYKEQYIPGIPSNPGYVKSWNDTIEVPCLGTSSHRYRYRLGNHYQPRSRYKVSKSLNHHHHHNHYLEKYYQPRTSYRVSKSNHQSSSCGAARTTTGGLLGGGLAAALSDKDAYGWSVPLGAVLGIGVANSNC